MKIPETSANIGAYYGNDENGQWQPNGMIIDNGVGGGVVGSGDAGVRPVYPVHIPRHMPAGYVMAGAYYPPQFAAPVPPQPADFEDYMWMENEEEFDKQVIQQLEEEALMEQCIEAMLEDEQREKRGGARNPRHAPNPDAPTTSSCNGNPGLSLEEAVSRSTLNPLAAEFVPTRVSLPSANPNPPKNKEVKPESTEAPSTEEKEPSRTDAPESDPVTETKPELTEETKTEESLTPPKDPPEVSAADVQPIQKKTKDQSKRPAKIVQELKKVKPAAVKSETKVQPKKKEVREVKLAKSEAKLEESANSASEDVVDSAPQPQPPTPTEEPTFPGLKPINYAAAAKAMKPKAKPTAIDKPIEKKESKPIEKKESRPIEKKESKPIEKKESKPIEKKESKPIEKKELKPIEKKELKSVKSTPKVNKEKVRKNSAK